jgi:hypothetical protein
MTGPQDPAAAGRDRLRAGHADREQVIEALKAAFVQGMLAKDEFDARVGQALASRTYADLAALTADILPARPQPGWRARLPRSAFGRWSGRPPSRAPAWSSQPLPCGAPPSSIRVPTSQVTVVAGLPWCCSSPFAPCWLHSASWRAGWSSHGSKDAPAGSCHPGRGRAATP